MDISIAAIRFGIEGRELTLAHYRHLCPDNGSDVDTGKKREVQMTSRTNGRLIASLSPSLQKIQHKPYQQNEGFAKRETIL